MSGTAIRGGAAAVGKLTAAGAAVMLSAALLTPFGTAQGASAQSWLPDVRLSADLPGPAVVSGTLVDASSRPVAAGHVTLMAWPTNDQLALSRVGDQLNVFPVGKALSGPDGKFGLRVDPAAPLFEAMTADGTVNFDLIASSPGGVAVLSFSRRLDRSAWRPAGPAQDLDPDGVLGAPLALHPAPAGAPVTPASSKYCVTTVQAQYAQRLSTVGELYTGPVAKGTVTYTTGSSTALGVGFSMSGAVGSWSASGTQSWSTSTTNSFGQQPQNTAKLMNTYYSYQKTNTQCWDTGAYQSYFEFRPYRYDAGTNMPASSTPSYLLSNCVPYYNGGGLTRITGSGFTFSAGVKVSGVIGIDLSSKTDYTTSTSTNYTFTGTGKLCGSNSTPPTAQRLIARGP